MQENRQSRASMAQETLDIIEKGYYINTSGKQVNFKEELRRAVSGTRTFTPDELDKICLDAGRIIKEKSLTCAYDVTDETTLECAMRLITEEKLTDVCCLNFASAKNPGGGFLGGSQAQEESLARSSGLYACLKPQTKMYDANRAFSSSLYTDNMIFSPLVPVFRDDDGRLLSVPYLISMLTAPAVNAGALKTNEPQKMSLVGKGMLQRIIKLLSLAIANGQRTLILGAWGCGVFQNKPEDVADYFREALRGDTKLEQGFEKIIFAIPDRSDQRKIARPFEDAFLH